MRFVIQSRAVLQALKAGEFSPAIAAVAAVPLEPLMKLLENYGRATYYPFMAAHLIEVDNVRGFTAEISRHEAGFECEIRPARAIGAIGPPTFDPGLNVPTSFERLGVEQLWDLGIKGQNVKIGVIDRGFGSHPSLSQCVKSHGHYDPKQKKVVKDPIPKNPSIDHGTFAAGLIAGAPIKGTPISVAPEAHLHLVELGSERPEERLEDDLARVIEYLARDVKCQVISLSLGTWEPAAALDAAIYNARELGALVVVAIGNDGKGIACWPGACTYALSVGFSGENGDVPRQSGSTHFDRVRHPLVPLVVAPGILLKSVQLGATAPLEGTGSSFAAPLVAGLAGLLFSDCSGANPALVEEAITLTCEYKTDYAERCAFGFPSAVKAREYLRSHPSKKC